MKILHNLKVYDHETGKDRLLSFVKFHNGYYMTLDKYLRIEKTRLFRRSVINRHYGLCNENKG